MRLDKFLKVSRLIKRRTVAKEVADQGRVEINGRVAKSGAQVAQGDQLTIRFGNRRLTVEVTQLLESTKKEDADTMYQIVKEERLDTNATEESAQSAQM